MDMRIAFIFGTVAMAGTYLGARLAVFFSGSAQLILFATVMLFAAYFMFRDRRPEPGADHAAKRMPLALMASEGLVVGALTGLVGVGGGFLIVPALVLLGGLPMKQAVGTSLFVIALKSAAGVAGYVGQVEVPWGFVALFAGVAIGGAYAGGNLVRYVPAGTLKKGFALFLVVIGSFILWENRDVLVSFVG